MMQKKGITSIVIVLLFLPSCIKKKESATDRTAQLPISFERLSVEDIRQMRSQGHMAPVDDQNILAKKTLSLCEQEAKYADLPTHFTISPVAHHCYDNKNSLVLSYTTHLNHQETIDFYQNEMERLGWSKRIYFESQEPLMLFEKPKRVAAVLVRSGTQRNDKMRTQITVFMEKG